MPEQLCGYTNDILCISRHALGPWNTFQGWGREEQSGTEPVPRFALVRSHVLTAQVTSTSTDLAPDLRRSSCAFLGSLAVGLHLTKNPQVKTGRDKNKSQFNCS